MMAKMTALIKTIIASFILSLLPSDSLIVSDIGIINSYTIRQGPIGESQYKWDALNSGSTDLIIDVGLPSKLKLYKAKNGKVLRNSHVLASPYSMVCSFGVITRILRLIPKPNKTQQQVFF